MPISATGAAHAHAIVSTKVSAKPPEVQATEIVRESLPETRKTLPEQAKGAANGHSVQKVFDKWDKDADGTITADEAGPRFGRGLLAALLKLQESAPAEATPPLDEPQEDVEPQPVGQIVADEILDEMLEQVLADADAPPPAEAD